MTSHEVNLQTYYYNKTYIDNNFATKTYANDAVSNHDNNNSAHANLFAQKANNNHNHDGVYLKTHQTLSDIGGVVTVEKLSTAEGNNLSTYVVKQNGIAVGDKINIPKDFLVKSASLETCSATNQPISGLDIGDKYLDFVINSYDNNTNTNNTHIYINLGDIIGEQSGYLTSSDISGKLDINQGTNYSGDVMTVDSNGNIRCFTPSINITLVPKSSDNTGAITINYSSSRHIVSDDYEEPL